MKHDVRKLEAGRNLNLTSAEREAFYTGMSPEDVEAIANEGGPLPPEAVELDSEDDDSFCIFCRCFGRGCNCP